MPSLQYTSRDALYRILPEHVQGLLTSDSIGDSTINTTLLDETGIEAESLFNSYAAAGNYTLPIRDADNVVPPVIILMINRVWRYLLFSRSNPAQAEQFLEEYEDALAWMRDIGKGKASIYLGDTAENEAQYRKTISITKKSTGSLEGMSI